MHKGEKMSFKVGDKVIMSKKGFKYYSDITKQFEASTVCGVINELSHFEQAVCCLFSIHGIGTIKKINEYGVLYIKWEYKLDGIKYHYTHYFENGDIKKISFLDRLKFKIRGLV
jgi:hypothetical protein